jgi:nucleotidyltransferase/DNA polymerase involved in DNA repair
VIVAHLDLDAFFAAVEELETPELRRSRSWSAATRTARRRRDGELRGAQVRDPLGDVVCRGAASLPAGGLRHTAQAALLGVHEGGLSAVREVVPTVERTGMDEGYLDVGEVAADFGPRTGGRRGGAGRGSGRDEPLVLARCL